jgi:malonyl-CoA decarboxylase
VSTNFFGDMLQSIAERSRALIDRKQRRGAGDQPSAGLIKLCEDLLSRRGEASGVALAREILSRYAELDAASRLTFFQAVASRFGPDGKRLTTAANSWLNSPTEALAAKLHRASEPRRMELFRRLNLAPDGTASLVRVREHLIEAMDGREELLRVVDDDFLHLFSSWFNRGFLVLRRIDWSTPAKILEKIIRYEAVHEIRDWNDLRARVDSPDRRCYAFFHPALIDEPLIFVEVALTRGIPGAIAPILATEGPSVDLERVTTAAFYSISNCQRGLAGVSFGHFLIKQVVEEVRREIARLSTFVTLSPAPEFAAWLKAERAAGGPAALDEDDRAALAALDQPDWWQDEETASTVQEPLLRAAAWYFLRGRTSRGLPRDPVARFHLGNGARLERLNFLADTSSRGMAQSYGLMVNYLYDLDHIEQNHEAFAQQHSVIAASTVNRLVRAPAREVAPVDE